MKLPILQLSPFSRYFIPLRLKYSPQHPVLRHPQSVLFRQFYRPSFTLYETTGRIMVLNILTIKFLDNRQEGRRIA
jgi:hypothetical protein